MPAANLTEPDRRPAPAISLQQLAATAAPEQRTSDLIGNFGDFDSLFEQLSGSAVIELGKPLPKVKYLPRKRIGNCPTAHNDALLGANRRQAFAFSRSFEIAVESSLRATPARTVRSNDSKIIHPNRASKISEICS